MTEPVKPPSPEPNRRHVLSNADWEHVRIAYASGTMSVIELAAKFGVKQNAIYNRVKKFNWEKAKKRGVSGAYIPILPEPIYVGLGEVNEVERGIIAKKTHELWDAVARDQRPKIGKGTKIIEECLDRLLDAKGTKQIVLQDGTIVHVNAIKEIKNLMQALDIAIQLERQNFGMDRRDKDGNQPDSGQKQREEQQQFVKMVMEATVEAVQKARSRRPNTIIEG